MAEIFLFKPKATLTAAENLEAFISQCRDQLTVFGSDCQRRVKSDPLISPPTV